MSEYKDGRGDYYLASAAPTPDTEERPDPFAWWKESRYSVQDLQRAYAQGQAAATPPQADRGLHGVAVVDALGPECICGKDFPFGGGGWVAFNAHLAAALRDTPPAGLDASEGGE